MRRILATRPWRRLRTPCRRWQQTVSASAKLMQEFAERMAEVDRIVLDGGRDCAADEPAGAERGDRGG